MDGWHTLPSDPFCRSPTFHQGKCVAPPGLFFFWDGYPALSYKTKTVSPPPHHAQQRRASRAPALGYPVVAPPHPNPRNTGAAWGPRSPALASSQATPVSFRILRVWSSDGPVLAGRGEDGAAQLLCPRVFRSHLFNLRCPRRPLGLRGVEDLFTRCTSFFDSANVSAWCALARSLISRSSPVSAIECPSDHPASWRARGYWECR